MSNGQWVVDYGNTLVNNIQHKEFETEEEAIEWGKSQIGQTYTVAGQTYPINYIHKVYEPVWHNEGDVPIEEIFKTEEIDVPTSANQTDEEANEDSEAAPAQDIREE